MLLQFRKSWLLPLMMGIVITAALVLTTPVSADDGQPMDPQPATEVATQPQTGSSASTDTTTPPQTPADEPAVQSAPVSTEPPAETAAVPADPASTETPADPAAAPVDATATPEDGAATEQAPVVPAESASPAAAPTVQETVADLAESDVVLASPTGEPVTLASNDTSSNLLTGDPYFWVGSVQYQFLKSDGDCGVSATCFKSPLNTPIQDALNYMALHNVTPTDRKLYIMPDTYTEDVMVNGAGTYNGVKGLLGIIGMGATPDDVKVNGSLTVMNMLSGFSITNLSVEKTSGINTYAVSFYGNAGTITLTDVTAKATGEDSGGIRIKNHTGAVVLNRVNASENSYHGALIDVNGSVTVTNSQFDNNLRNVVDGITEDDSYIDEFGIEQQYASYDSLDINAHSAPVTLYGVSTQGNQGSGTNIRGTSVSVKNSIFTNNISNLDGDWGYGIWMGADTITMENIQAQQNVFWGISGWAKNSFTGTSLYLFENNGLGLSMDTCWDDDGTGVCPNPGAGTITIKNSSAFNNKSMGFYLESRGVISLTNVGSGNNGEDGFTLLNNEAPLPANILITNVQADNNHGNGFVIRTRGAVTMSTFTSDNNDIDGLSIVSTGSAAMTITNVSGVFNETVNNGGKGYSITTKGAVAITNLDAYGNCGGLGGTIINIMAAFAAPVTITTLGPTYSYSGYDSNSQGGLSILSQGVVTISRIGASNNGGPGVVIKNIPTIMNAPGVAVSVSDIEISNNNDGTHMSDGLTIDSKGAITLLNVKAMDNDGRGASITNNTPGATGGVTINAGTNLGNYFINNSAGGLQIRTNGAVTLTNVNATGNSYGYGADIDNSTGTGSVTINAVGTWGANFDYNDPTTWGNSFSRNGYDGLSIMTKGAVTVYLNHASENQWYGINISAPISSGAVILNGYPRPSDSTGDVYGNGSGGVVIVTKGSITLNKVWVSNNSDWGANLMNNPGTGSITLTTAFFDNNTNGLRVDTTGSVYWKIGTASGNANAGASIDNDVLGAAAKPVTIISVSTTSNGETGLDIISKGAVTITDVDANNNSAQNYTILYGERWQDNISDNQTWYFDGTSSDKVTVKVHSDRFYAYVFITDQDGNEIPGTMNSDMGVTTLTIDSLPQTGAYSIHIKTDKEYANNGYQISLYQGSIEPGESEWVDKASVAYGIKVDNHDGINAPVSIISSYQRWNGNNSGTDVYVMSSGAVTLKNFDLNDSSMGGLYVDNTSAPVVPQVTPAGVTLTSVNFYSNDQTGAEIKTNGPVVITTSDANDNAGGGYAITNNFSKAVTNVTMTNINANGNKGGDGINILSNGAISLKNASSSNNALSGFQIITLGSITLSQVNGPDNWEMGAYLKNNTGTGSVTLTDAYFDNNGDGLIVRTTGAVYWKNGSAANNWKSGADIKNLFDSLSNVVKIAKPVTIININTQSNGESGLSVLSKGAVTITDVDSTQNSVNFEHMSSGDRWQDNLTDNQTWFFDGIGGDKLTVKVSSDYFTPSIKITDQDGNFIASAYDANGLTSLTIDSLPYDSKYAIHLNSDIGYNGYPYQISLYTGDIEPTYVDFVSIANGIKVDNSSGVNAPVMITNTFMRWIGNNSGTEIDVKSSGAVTLSNLELNDSAYNGLFVDNTTAPVVAGVVPAGVTLTNVNFHTNADNGAEIHTNGPVVVKNGNAGNNGGQAYDITNNSSAAVSGVTFTDVNINDNGAGGIKVVSKGPVTFTRIGAYNNKGTGIDISTQGAVSFDSIRTPGNGGNGARVVTTGSVIITTTQPTSWMNSFSGNTDTGLWIDAGGKVTLLYIAANNNGSRDDDGNPLTDAFGVWIRNTGNTLGTAPVVLTNVYAYNNTRDGIYLETASAITASHIEANNNTGYGMFIDQSNASNSLLPVNLSQITTSNNGKDGLFTDVKGNIIVNKITSMFNKNNGVNLSNNAGAGTVTVLNTLGANTVIGNGQVGMNIGSNGMVAVTGLEVSGNNYDGLVVINNYLPALSNTVTLTSIISRYNGWSGVTVESNGIVTLNNTWSTGNKGDGIKVTSSKNVYFTNTTAINNEKSGFRVSIGALNTLFLTNSTWFGNLRSSTGRNLECPLGTIKIL